MVRCGMGGSLMFVHVDVSWQRAGHRRRFLTLPLFFRFQTLRRGSISVATILIDAGGDPNSRVSTRQSKGLAGGTALHLAVGRGQTEMVEFLLARGAGTFLAGKNVKEGGWCREMEGGYLGIYSDTRRLLICVNPRGTRSIIATACVWVAEFPQTSPRAHIFLVARGRPAPGELLG